MGNYSYEEHYELFGGPPDPGEAYPSLEQIDNLRKAEKEGALSASAGGGAASHPSEIGSAPPAVDLSVDLGCPNCEAPAGQPCQHWCHWEAIS